MSTIMLPFTVKDVKTKLARFDAQREKLNKRMCRQKLDISQLNDEDAALAAALSELERKSKKLWEQSKMVSELLLLVIDAMSEQSTDHGDE
jgi:septal ring factor EnvC (AmiA/AmiB activator)